MKTNMKAEDLRKSIYQRAIQGKLVPQDPNDEPASVLLERIKAEKEQLIKEGKIKRDKNESYIFKGDDNRYYEKIGKEVKDITENLPFEIPDNWMWVRLSSITSIEAGGTPDRSNPIYWQNGTIPWVKISDITSASGLLKSTSENITESGLNNSSAKIFTKGTILYTIFASIGEIAVLDIDASTNQAIVGITPYGKIDKYLFLYLKNLKDFLKSISKGCAQMNINQKILKESLVALPPLKEQIRIINTTDKIDEKLSLYGTFEINLSTLEKDFPEQLKKSILQYAIQGKLVSQDPNVEPASVLLERIKAEKEQLIKEGKIKRDKNESVIYQGADKNYYEKVGKEIKDITDDLPFEIPDNWMWVRFSELVSYKLGKTPNRNNLTLWGKDIPWVSIADMKEKETITTTKEKISEKAFTEIFSKNISPEGTLIMSFKLTVGRVSILGMDAEHNEAIISIFPYLDPSNITRDYLFYVLGELVNYCEKTDAIKGTTLNKEKMNKMLIPVPPLEEQHRINISLKSLFDYVQQLF